jgi:hypothetical protein
MFAFLKHLAVFFAIVFHLLFFFGLPAFQINREIFFLYIKKHPQNSGPAGVSVPLRKPGQTFLACSNNKYFIIAKLMLSILILGNFTAIELYLDFPDKILILLCFILLYFVLRRSYTLRMSP